MVFEVGVARPVGQSEGVQGNTLIFNRKYLPKVSRLERVLRQRVLGDRSPNIGCRSGLQKPIRKGGPPHFLVVHGREEAVLTPNIHGFLALVQHFWWHTLPCVAQ